MLFAAALIFTGCSNGSDSGGTPPTLPVPGSFAVNFSVDGGNGTLKAKADGIPETDVSPITVEQGKTVTFTAVPAANYKVKEWKVDGTVISNTSSAYIHTVTKAAEVKVSFEALPPGEASYTVKHYREKTDGTYPAEPSDSETLNGTAGDSVAFMPKTSGDYEGFTYNSALTMVNGAIQTSGPIQADGSTVVELYYERKTVNVTFKLAGGTVAGSTADVVKTGKYGTVLSAPVPVQTGFSFTGWHPALPATPVFPASDRTYTAQWTQFQFKIDFGVDGGNGTLTAKVDGAEINSGDTVEHGKTVVFTAEPAGSNYAVEKWTNNGTVIAGAGTNTTYNHTVTAAANIKVKFKYAGPALTVDTTAFTKTAGDEFEHRFVTAGSGSYTAEAETPNILYLNLYNLNSQGKIWVQCVQAGSTRIKITDMVSGQTVFSGLITVKPDEDYFEEGGMRYRITDKTAGAEKVSVTAETAHYIYAPYTVPSLTIPKEVTHGGVTYTVTSVEWVNEWGTTLQSVTVASDNAYLLAENGVIFNKDKTVLLGYLPGKPDVFYTVPASVTKLADASLSNVPALTSVTLPDGLKTIEDFVLVDCENLVALNLPSSLKSIGWRSLWSIKVSSIVVPENITQLWDLFLSRCPELTSVELPSTLTKMSGHVLTGDPKLKTVMCKAATPPVINGNAFKNTPIASATLRVPAGSKALYQAAEGWKDFGTIVEF